MKIKSPLYLLFCFTLVLGTACNVNAQEQTTKKQEAPAKKVDDKQKQAQAPAAAVPAALNFTMKSIDGKDVKLGSYVGNVVLVVNTASKCGLTPQYKGLQQLHDKYGDKGLKVIGFPCNQFGGQEPGTESDIQEFCQKNYGVEFDMFAKIDVNGNDACDLYKHLTNLDLKPQGKGKIKWNFEKFLLGKDGKPIARFSPRVTPDDETLIKAIDAALAK